MSGKNNSKNDELAILDRRKRVARKYLEGYSQTTIAEVEGVTQPTIANDLKAIRAGWEASAILDWDAAKSRQLEALDHQIEVLWQAWYRSCELEQVKTRDVKRELRVDPIENSEDKKGSKGGRKGVVVTQSMVPVSRSTKLVERQLIGDPRYMSEIRACRELQCKILGILKDDKPQQNNTQTNFFVLLEEAMKPQVDPAVLVLEQERAKVAQLTEVKPKDTTT